MTSSKSPISVSFKGGFSPEQQVEEDAPPEKDKGGEAELREVDRHLDSESNRKLREEYAGKAYLIVCWSLLLWATVVVVQVVLKIKGQDVLSDTALGIITTGATVNMIAAFIAIAKGLFPTEKSAK